MRLRALPADGFVARAVHVFVLAALAVAQPLWSLLSANPEFFVARDADRAEIVAAAAIVLLVPALVVVAVEGLARLGGERWARRVHVVAVAGFGALLFLRVFTRWFGDPAWLVVGLSVAGGAGIAAYYATTRGVRQVLTALTPLPVVFLAMFLLGDGVRPLVLSSATTTMGAIDVRRKAPVVLLVFDEFPGTSYLTPSLTIDPHRAPNLAAFARTATWYRDATTVHEVSEMAIPAIQTGIRSTRRRLPTAASFPVNVFSVLTAGGYDVHADESITRLCTTATCGERPPRGPLPHRVKSELSDLAVLYGHQVTPRDLADRLPDIGLAWGNFRGREKEPAKPEVGSEGVVTDLAVRQGPRVDRFLSELAPSATPSLHYLHVLIPHAPFDHLPNGKQYLHGDSFVGLDERTGYWSADTFATDQAEQRRQLQVGYADWQIGRVMARLREVGLFDKSLVVVVGDHGSTTLPGANRRAFAPASLADIASVPLFVKLPGQTKGETSDVNAETVDVLPTIADALGLRLPGAVDGHSLLGPPRPPHDKVLINQFGVRFTLPDQFPSRRESVARIYSIFARQGASLNLFATGPYKSLVGRRWRTLPGASGRFVARVDKRLWTTGLTDGLSPAHAMGRLDGTFPSGGPVHLLIAVGDRIVATSRSYDVRGSAGTLSILVPDEALRPGHGQVRLFAVTGPPAHPTLTTVRW